uniref:BPTI/Kunitz inhibitor domain-containing protein n=2 Tax=Wuchereria bancrofti TaxID=6293 RepID=A0AAF5PS51_WUCBA
MSGNDETRSIPAKPEVDEIVDIISGAITDPCLRSLPTGFQLQYCSPADSFLCPHGTFCQIGAGPQETFCCPIIADNPCKQTQESGIGLTGLRRWYYDASDNFCKTFVFNGFKGNQNNFLTFRACQQSCGATNPCANGEPEMQTSAHEQCTPENVYSCSKGYYCRILDDLTKTACCPGTDQTMLNHGKNMIPNPTANIHSAYGSTYNEFTSSSGISSTFAKSRIVDSTDTAEMAISGISPVRSIGYVNAKPIISSEHLGYISGTPTGIKSGFGNASQPSTFASQLGARIEAPDFSGANAFVNFYSGIPKSAMISESIGSGIPIFPGGNPVGTGISTDSSVGTAFGSARIINEFNTGVQNLVSNTAMETIQGIRCLQPLVPGTGTYSLPRYYFDSEASLCRPFIYSGFGGNDNSFETIQECRIVCPEYDNPCPLGLPYVDGNDGNVAFCSSFNPLCPPNYWCHIGDRRQTSVCCPSLANVNTVPIANPLRPLRSLVSMNFMQNLNGPALDTGTDSTEQNDMVGIIPLVCFQPMLEGRGQAKLTRYYFNSITRTCEKFIYSGKGGNQNNFLSKMDCEETCPILENPCENGLPAIGPEGNPILCDSDTTTTTPKCGIGYYCHIGATSSTTVCCPAIGDPCRMPVSIGNGNAVLNRWYYNTQSQICVNFVYSGQGGNSNNFRTREDCIKACPEFRNPCSTGRPHIGLSGQITHCGATGPLICPTTYWCHIGASLENSVCCPANGIPCEQELEIGSGDSLLVRFYYDSSTRTCQQFQYSGLGGNENNFLTLRDCEARCPVLPNPCGLGQPQIDEHQNPVMCSATDASVCNMGYFCHIGDTEETTVCCPGKSNDICNEPRVPGTGEAHLNRYAFASLTKQCLPFIYTGLGGNENNFLSRASCEATCPVISNPCADGEPAAGSDGRYLICSTNGPNICPIGYWCHVGADIAASLCCPGAQNACVLPLAEGSGSVAIPRWYFDRRLHQCATFTYSGYGGNQNNFQTLKECQEKCPELTNPCSMGDPAESLDGNILQCTALHPQCPTSYFCNIGATPETSVCCPSFGQPCLSPLVVGTGNASLSRWFFDQNSRQCLQFIYTGLGGNENNFLTAEACMQKCPVLRNPCPFESTIASSNNLLALAKCNVQNAYYCPPTYWCHVGGDADTTVCCPGAADPCQLSLSQGIATDKGPYTRWFYDRISGSCKPFQYAGIGGNQNNFLTRSDCAKHCPEGQGPVMIVPPLSLSPLSNLPVICPTGLPYQDANEVIRHCSVTNPCPVNYFCHIGVDISTTVCCKVTTFMSPCSIPVQIGHGIGQVKRVYYNAALRQCIPFIYSGMGGNENNFLTIQECAVKCLNDESNVIRYFDAGSINSGETNCNETNQANSNRCNFVKLNDMATNNISFNKNDN